MITDDLSLQTVSMLHLRMFLEMKARIQSGTDGLEKIVRLCAIDAMVVSYSERDLSHLVSIVVLVLVQAQTDVGSNLGSPIFLDLEPVGDVLVFCAFNLVVERDWGGG